MDNTIESISKSLIKYPLLFEISPKGFLWKQRAQSLWRELTAYRCSGSMLYYTMKKYAKQEKNVMLFQIRFQILKYDFVAVGVHVDAFYGEFRF